MSDHRPSAFKPLTLLALALALGVIAGIGAVYVKGTAPVHAPDAVAVVEMSESQSACTISDATKAVLDAAATGDVAAMLPATEARDLSKLSFSGPDGAPLSIGSFKGRTVLLNLWATWCVPCREEMPALNALQAKAGNESFEVVAINVDSGEPEKRKAFLTDMKIDALKDYSEPSMTLFNDLKRQGLAFGLPLTLLISANGCLLSAMNGPANWSGDDALKLVAAAQGLKSP